MPEKEMNPSFPKVKLVVKDRDGKTVIYKSPCLPHELSAVLAIFNEQWTVELSAVV